MVLAKSTLSLSSSEYVSHVVALPSALVAATTDGTLTSIPIAEMCQSAAPTEKLSILDKSAAKDPIINLLAVPSSPLTVASCNSAGKLRLFDLRVKNAVQQTVDAMDSQLKATAMGVSNFGEIALGTEASPDAEIYIYDIRQLRSAKPMVKYSDSHNDDVTDLQFHPLMRNMMVSGSTDGIVNLFNMSITDEDEAVLAAYNSQASVHRTGFFTDSSEAIRRLNLHDKPGKDRLFALSHMETLTVFPVDLDDDNWETNLGKDSYKEPEAEDLRSAWKCQYVADYQKHHFLVGSNDEQWASLVPILDGTPQPHINLEGGHGSEVVRCFDMWQGSTACFTGGEDGTIKLWDMSGQFESAARVNEQLAKEEKSRTHKKPSKSSNKVLKRMDPIGKPKKN